LRECREGTFASLEEAQNALCPKHRVIEPDPKAARVYEELYALYANCIWFRQAAARHFRGTCFADAAENCGERARHA